MKPQIFKLKIELPPLEKITEGLSLHECYPKLAIAERALAKAESDFENSRTQLAELEREALRLPELVHRGETPLSDLTACLYSRDAAALLIPQFEAALTSPIAALEEAKAKAAAALNKEIGARREILEKAALLLAPVLDQLKQSDRRLGAASIPRRSCVGLAWAKSVRDESALYRSTSTPFKAR